MSSSFVWYELMTTDTKAAETFYRDAVGLGAKDAAVPGMNYTLLTKGETHIAGVMDLPADAKKMGMPPNWIGYVAVDDVDAAAGRVKQLGGSVHAEPRDIPNVGRFAIVADPQNVVVALFKSSSPAQQSTADTMSPGHIGWHELMAVDWEKAWSFYSEMFGWQKADAMDMGPMGKYQLFTAGAHPIGGMFNKPPEVPVPFWLYYFNVGDIDAAAGRVTAGNGKILNGPMEVPGGQWIVQCMDPQGAMFALVGKKGG
jgi:predicted enzyme related to lactoylglutathione lyase